MSCTSKYALGMSLGWVSDVLSHLLWPIPVQAPHPWAATLPKTVTTASYPVLSLGSGSVLPLPPDHFLLTLSQMFVKVDGGRQVDPEESAAFVCRRKHIVTELKTGASQQTRQVAATLSSLTPPINKYTVVIKSRCGATVCSLPFHHKTICDVFHQHPGRHANPNAPSQALRCMYADACMYIEMYIYLHISETIFSRILAMGEPS